MKFRFDHKHYVPVLRWKRGERVALRELTFEVRSRITPLLELVHTKNDSPAKISNDVRKDWGQAPFFLDDINFSKSNDSTTVVVMNEAMRSHGVNSIPVTGLGRGYEHQAAVGKVAASDRRGICIRLYSDDLRSPSLGESLDKLLSLLSLDPSQVDLIADYQLVSNFAMPFATLCQKLRHLPKWRTFTVISGAFSLDLQEYKKNGQYTRPREDWMFWQNQVASRLQRRPTYGDYSIQYALFKEPPEFCNPSGSIRYASHDHWVIMRGEGLKNDGGPGYEQYAAHAQLLCEREEYCGPGFSYGDRYIDNLNKGLEGSGSPEILLRAGINHHVTLVVDQISNLAETSTGDALVPGHLANQQPPRVEHRLMREAYSARSRPRQVRPTK